MRKQKGQSVVEFSVMMPLILLCMLGLIYGGFTYADYLQYNNAVRDAARDIAVAQEDQRQGIVAGLNSNSKETVSKYVTTLPSFYKATFHAKLEEEYVEVRVDFKSNIGWAVMPDEFSTNPFTMQLEKSLTVLDNEEDNP